MFTFIREVRSHRIISYDFKALILLLRVESLATYHTMHIAFPNKLVPLRRPFMQTPRHLSRNKKYEHKRTQMISLCLVSFGSPGRKTCAGGTLFKRNSTLEIFLISSRVICKSGSSFLSTYLADGEAVISTRERL